MTKIPEPTITIAKLINKAVQVAHDEEPRGHFGASMAGDRCMRKLWLRFHWAVRQEFDGRILRLFQRGHDQEEAVVDWLRKIGCVVQYTGKTQKRVEFSYSVSGSLDGIIESGLPGAEKTRHILEIKTHNKKSFDDLVKHGVEKSKPVHFVQMQIYMYGADINRALYFAVCKDDDRIYTERVRLDDAKANHLVNVAEQIAAHPHLPEPMPGASPDWYLCKFCEAHSFCHETHLTTEVNCRTCAHFTVEQNNTFTCARFDNSVIEEKYQRIGCESHVLHPDLVPWQRLPSPSEHEAVYLIDNVEVRNGEPCKNVWSSKEILAKTSEVVDPSPVVEILRDKFDARIIDIDADWLPF